MEHENFDSEGNLTRQNLLGVLLAYFGTVEEQGRGGLHTHYTLHVAGRAGVHLFKVWQSGQRSGRSITTAMTADGKRRRLHDKTVPGRFKKTARVVVSREREVLEREKWCSGMRRRRDGC